MNGIGEDYLINPKARRPGRANYGLDRPDIVVRLLIGGLVTLVLSTFSAYLTLYAGIIDALIWFGLAGVFVVSSKVLKVRIAATLIDSIPWRGDERVLDVGCGRGLLLVTAAKGLRTGKAVGIDIWEGRHQTRNRPSRH